MLVPLAFSSAKPRDSGLDFTMATEALGYLPHTRTSCKSTPCHSCLQGVLQDSSMVLYPPSLPSSLPILGTCLSVCPAVTSCSAFSCWTTGGLRPFLENRTGPFEIKGLNLDKHWLVGKWSGRPSSQRETDLGLGMTSSS